MRLSLRFIIPLVLALSALAYAAVPLIDNLTLRWFMRDLDIRAQLVANTLEEPLAELAGQQRTARMATLFSQAVRDERLFAIALCGPDGRILSRTPTFTGELKCTPPPSPGEVNGMVARTQTGPVYISRFPMAAGGVSTGTLILVHDMSFIERRGADTRRYVIVMFLVLGIVVSLITVLVAHLSWRGWIAGVRLFLQGEGLVRPFSGAPVQPTAEIRPLIGDMRALMREAAEERHAGEDITTQWTPQTLKQLLHDRYQDDQVIVVSNREPYIHDRTPEGVVIRTPASGLVTAIEPVMRACSGTWIAHGSGSADRESADAHSRLLVPPDNPAYTLRRVWMSEEEERGYYYGFANEGLWPLCHMAHVRPTFRRSDWDHYVAINQRFADAVAEEASTDNPLVLVQDYHFALLPGMIRKRLPRATIIAFWHIPWPNHESFGICPWREELLEGMLGSTILGFHTVQHCRNFTETVDRYLEARIEHESATISHRGMLTRVEAYPISIDWPDQGPAARPAHDEAGARIRGQLGVPPGHIIGLGVDRLDYTKGIVERLQAVECMLERHPDLRGRFTFVQIAAPTRSSLEEYQSFENRVRAESARINARFADSGRPPIHLLIEHHESSAVFDYYRACNLCVVTSLHDGMNLVAKEFVSARDDEQGALVLSQFAGASRELYEALIVNPYDVEQTADAIFRAATMPPGEQRGRMRALRAVVKDFNIYRWAGRMLLDAAVLRQRERLSERFSPRAGSPLRRVI